MSSETDTIKMHYAVVFFIFLSIFVMLVSYLPIINQCGSVYNHASPFLILLLSISYIFYYDYWNTERDQSAGRQGCHDSRRREGTDPQRAYRLCAETGGCKQ